MKTLKPRVKISGQISSFVAVLLAGVVLAGVEEAAARSMSNHNVGAGNGRPPAHNTTNHPIVSKPGKPSGKADKTVGRDHDRGKDHADRKAAREERRREREDRQAGRMGSCVTRGGCRGPTVEVRDH